MAELSWAKQVAELGAVAVVLVLVIIIVLYLINSNRKLQIDNQTDRAVFHQALNETVKGILDTITAENRSIEESFRQNQEAHRYQREEHNELKETTAACARDVIENLHRVELTIAKANGKNHRARRK